MDHSVEIFDQVLLLFNHTGFNDHQLHCVLKFESGLDAEVLRKAVISSIEAVPILGTRYVDKGLRPRWESLDRARFRDAFTIARTQAEFDEFVTFRTDETAGPQVKVCLLGPGRSTVAITMNHMVCDAAGFKQYLYFLCEIYTGIMADAGYRPAAVTGDRSINGVLERFGMGIKLKSLLVQRKESNHCGNRRFPFSEGGDERPFILTRKLERESSKAIKSYCRARGVTMNDVMLAAYYRCTCRRLALPCGAELRIPVMVDMRRYLEKTAGFDALTNITSMVVTRLKYRPEEDFANTLARVKAVMDRSKAGHIGLSGFLKLDLLYKVFPKGIATRLLRFFLDNPLISMTNVGILDSARMSFGGLRPYDAFMSGSIQHKPHFQIAVSTYDDELTFSSNLCGNASDRERTMSFLEKLERELLAQCSLVEQGEILTQCSLLERDRVSV